MTMSPAALLTARRNLVLRLERFLRSIDQPTSDQMANLRDALAALDAGNYPVGEEAVFLAEKGWRPRYPATEPAHTLAELVEWFERVRVEE